MTLSTYNIDETGRLVQERKKEHVKHVKHVHMDRTQTSAVSEHVITTSHCPDKQNITSLVKEAIQIRLRLKKTNRYNSIIISYTGLNTIWKHRDRTNHNTHHWIRKCIPHRYHLMSTLYQFTISVSLDKDYQVAVKTPGSFQ